MRTFGIVVGVVICGIAALVAIYVFGYTHSFRYRLTVEVLADGELKSGSSVIQVNARLDFVPGRPLKYALAFSGDAVEVDLGPRGSLFALLKLPGGFNAASLPYQAFFPSATSADRAEHEQRFKLNITRIGAWSGRNSARARCRTRSSRWPSLK